HRAHKAAAHRHETGGDGALQILRRAHVHHARGNGAGRQAVLHQRDEHRVDDAQIHRTRFTAGDLRKHDFDEAFLAPQVFGQIGIAVRHALEMMGAKAGNGAVHASSFKTVSRTAFFNTLHTDDRGRLSKTCMRLGVCTGPSFSRTNAISAWGSTDASGCSCTAACTASPHLSSGTPNTEHSYTAGCRARAFSTSMG